MNDAKGGLVARLENGELILSIETEHTEPRKLSKDLSELCIALSATSCEEIPCMVLVKPFFTQLRWTSSGNLEEQTADTASLPSWPLRIFSPVLFYHERPVLFGPHLFGIDTLTNPSLAGFNLCRDFILCLQHQLLGLRSLHSLLVITISSSLKLEVQRLSRCQDAFTTTAGTWRLCLHCIPDPHAEALWQYHHNSLQPLIVADVLPTLAILDDEHLSSLSTVDSYTPIRIISRALLAYASAAISNAIYVHGYLSPSSFLRSAMQSEIASFQSLVDYLNILTNLVRQLDASSIKMNDANCDDILKDLVKVHMQSLLGLHCPFGHLALLDIARNWKHTTGSNCSAKIRGTLVTMLIPLLNERASDGIDTYLKAALLANHRSIYYKTGKLTDLASMNAVAHISFQFSQTNTFVAAILGFETILRYLEHDQRPSFQLWSVVASELMRCFNATGHENSAIKLMYSTLSRLKRDRFFHPLAHLRPELRLKPLDFEFLAKRFSSRPRKATEMIKISCCKPPLHITLDCLACGSLVCETCRETDYLTEDGILGSKSPSPAPREKFPLTPQKPAASFATSSSSNPDPGIVDLINLNFGVLTNLRITLSDAFIGKGSYSEARQTLEALLDLSPNVSSGSIYLVYLRLSKTMRRQTSSNANNPLDEEVTAMILNGLSEVSNNDWTFCFDEIEPTLLQISDRPGRKQEGLWDRLNKSLSKWQQQHPKDDKTHMIYTVEQRLEAQVRTEWNDNSIIEGLGSDWHSHSQSEIDVMTPFSSGHVPGPSPYESSSTDDPVMDYLPRVAHNNEGTAPVISLGTGVKVVTGSKHEKKSLLEAAEEGNGEIVQLLLDGGADIEAKDSLRWTPLHWAASNGHEKVVQLLLDRGADIEAKSNTGWTPLHYAAYNGHEKVVQLLKDRRSNITLIQKVRLALRRR